MGRGKLSREGVEQCKMCLDCQSTAGPYVCFLGSFRGDKYSYEAIFIQNVIKCFLLFTFMFLLSYLNGRLHF